ncbi:MAG: MaoC family dehydratase [Alphaproteobacteria bacterium]|nr:MaoC family dehydratase [Alphaproteobacteria bacterium]MDE2266644.1 MaoC family dehydratase [Alphaproteobacteria bacterium]
MKTHGDNFFEDFQLGRKIAHASPRTLTEGDAALYGALTGSRFILQASAPFARRLGYHTRPLDDFLVFNTVFGQSVSDISLNAVANLGYAEGRFVKPVHAGETLSAISEIIGLRETSRGDSGVVYVRTDGLNERGEQVLTYIRWVLVKKRDAKSPAPVAHVPELVGTVSADDLALPHHVDFGVFFDTAQSGSPLLWDDYAIGDRIDHNDGVAVEEAEHMTATRLYRNTARVHFDPQAGGFGKRLVYGGHILSLARALSFNGLANAVQILAINNGRHVAPVFAGDMLFAWSEVLDKKPLRKDCGALRLRLITAKNRACGNFPDKDVHGKYPDNIVLDFDYWALMPRG